jgi:hypothetical protein
LISIIKITQNIVYTFPKIIFLVLQIFFKVLFSITLILLDPGVKNNNAPVSRGIIATEYHHQQRNNTGHPHDDVIQLEMFWLSPS